MDGPLDMVISQDSVVSAEVKSTDSGARLPRSYPGFAICSSVTFKNFIALCASAFPSIKLVW